MRRNDRQEIRKEMRVILESLGWEPGQLDHIARGMADGLVEPPPALNKHVKVRDAHQKVLKSILKNPFLSVSEHSEQIGNISPHLMNRIIKELIEIGFLEEPLSFSLGLRGNPRKYLRITEKGAKFIRADLSKHQYPGRGSYENCLYQHIVQNHLQRKGRDCIVEHNLNGKSIDVVELGSWGKITGYEIELRVIRHVIDNINRDLEAGCNKVIIVTKNRAEQEKMRTLVYGELTGDKLSRVEFMTIGEFVK